LFLAKNWLASSPYSKGGQNLKEKRFVTFGGIAVSDEKSSNFFHQILATDDTEQSREKIYLYCAELVSQFVHLAARANAQHNYTPLV
jgi:hypothetical protein